MRRCGSYFQNMHFENSCPFLVMKFMLLRHLFKKSEIVFLGQIQNAHVSRIVFNSFINVRTGEMSQLAYREIQTTRTVYVGAQEFCRSLWASVRVTSVLGAWPLRSADRTMHFCGGEFRHHHHIFFLSSSFKSSSNTREDIDKPEGV